VKKMKQSTQTLDSEKILELINKGKRLYIARDYIHPRTTNSILLKSGTQLSQNFVTQLKKHSYEKLVVSEIKPEKKSISTELEPDLPVKMETMNTLKKFNHKIASEYENLTHKKINEISSDKKLKIKKISQNPKFQRAIFSSDTFKKLQKNIELIVEKILSNEIAISVEHIRSHDEYTEEHSYQVSMLSLGILSLVLKRRMLLRKSQYLYSAALGAMLHDIGKIAIPETILNKQDKLSAEENEIVKRHPEWGYELTAMSDSIDPLSRAIIWQHHENLDGSGYPDQAIGEHLLDVEELKVGGKNKISIVSKIVMVADRFDAMIADRPYRKGIPHEQTLNYLLIQSKKGLISIEAVVELINLIQYFPINILVTLNEQEFAFVINNKKNPSRPIVHRNDWRTKKLKDVIDDQPQTELHIYSQYSPSEDVYMPNLGVQRARKITQMLVNLGVPNNRLVIKPQIIPIQFDASNTYQSSFSFALKPLDSLRLNALRSNLPESRTIYPTYTFDGVLVNKDLRDFGKELKEMVINQPDLKIEVIGHTDNVGNAQDNYLKALDHARQVRWYLIKSSGIDKGRVKAKSMGETEAIAGNGSKNGRELNRRIEIKFYLDNVN